MQQNYRRKLQLLILKYVHTILVNCSYTSRNCISSSDTCEISTSFSISCNALPSFQHIHTYSINTSTKGPTVCSRLLPCAFALSNTCETLTTTATVPVAAAFEYHREHNGHNSLAFMPVVIQQSIFQTARQGVRLSK